METDLVTNLLGALALLPALITALKPRDRADGIFFATLTLAALGPIYWLLRADSHGWSSGLTGALWASIAGTLIVFVAVSILTRAGWRLAPLILPYAALVVIIAAVRASLAADDYPVITHASVWLIVHASASIMTYAIVTVGAVAAFAGFIQQHALKHKSPTDLSRRLPSLADCDALQIRLLGMSAVLLGLGLVSGSATLLTREGVWFALDHKTILGVLAFIVISALLVANRNGGVRARQIGRAALVAYLLLTLAYPGVKMVTDALL